MGTSFKICQDWISGRLSRRLQSSGPRFVIMARIANRLDQRRKLLHEKLARFFGWDVLACLFVIFPVSNVCDHRLRHETGKL